MADSNSAVQKQRLEKICEDLASEYPNMYNVVDKLKWKASGSIDTAAVDRQGRGIFSPEFIEGVGLDELRFVCMHEAMHVILLHHQRMGKIEDLYMPAANWAADYVINTNLNNNGFVVDEKYIGEWSAEDLTGKKADEIKDMSFEEIYELILEHMESQPQSGSSQQSNNGQGSQNNQRGNGSSDSQGDQSNQQNNSSTGGDSGSNQDSQGSQSGGAGESGQEEQGAQEGDGQGARQNDEGSDKESNGGSAGQDDSSEGDPLDGDLSSEGIIAKEYNGEQGAINNNGNGCGHQDDKATMEALLKESNVDLKKLLDAFVYKTSGRGTPARSYRRPNKRYRNVYPLTKGRIQEKPKDIVFAVDVSSSMDVEKTSRALSAVAKYAERYSVGLKYYFWSNSCSRVYDFTSQKKFVSDFKRNYGGGTEITAALRSRTADGLKNFAGIVIISDFEFGSYSYGKAIKDCGTAYFLVNVDQSTDLSSFPEDKYCNCY